MMATKDSAEKTAQDLYGNGDEKAIPAHEPNEYVEDADTAKRITRKCDLHILPWVCHCRTIQFKTPIC